MTRQITKKTGFQGCVILNDLFPGMLLLQVYHLKCAGYKTEHRPANNKPWFCHFCVANKGQHTVFLHPRRAAVSQSLVRLHINSCEDIERLKGISAQPLSKTIATARANARAASFADQGGAGELKKFTNKLNESMAAQDRLAKARMRTVLHISCLLLCCLNARITLS